MLGLLQEQTVRQQTLTRKAEAEVSDRCADRLVAGTHLYFLCPEGFRN